MNDTNRTASNMRHPGKNKERRQEFFTGEEARHRVTERLAVLVPKTTPGMQPRGIVDALRMQAQHEQDLFRIEEQWITGNNVPEGGGNACHLVHGHGSSCMSLDRLVDRAGGPVRVIQSAVPRKSWGMKKTLYTLVLDGEQEYVLRAAKYCLQNGYRIQERGRIGKRGPIPQAFTAQIRTSDAGPAPESPIGWFADAMNGLAQGVELKLNPDQAGHTIIVGPEGSGKSVLAGHLAALTLGRTRATVRVIRRPTENGQEFVTRAGGRYARTVQDIANAGATRVLGIDAEIVERSGGITEVAECIQQQTIASGELCLVWIDDTKWLAHDPDAAPKIRDALVQSRHSREIYMVCAQRAEFVHELAGPAATWVLLTSNIHDGHEESARVLDLDQKERDLVAACTGSNTAVVKSPGQCFSMRLDQISKIGADEEGRG